MSNSKRGPMFWLNVWFPVLLGATLIALESTETFGANHTSGPLRSIYQFFFGPVAESRWVVLHIYIRKSGHFLGYGVIGLAWLRAWWLTLPRSSFLPDAVLALLGTALVASADEWHQSFLPNRTGCVQDVLLDCCGAIVLELIVYVGMRLCMPKNQTRTA